MNGLIELFAQFREIKHEGLQFIRIHAIDAGKIERELGWTPEVNFTQLVEMMVDNDLAEQRALARL